MDGIESGPGPERDNPPLTQAELESLFFTVAHTLIKKGEPESGRGFHTPADRPGALFFRIDLEPSVVKDIFYPEDDTVEIVVSEHETFIGYTTPHATDLEDIENQASTVYLGVGGVVKGTDVAFIVECSVTEGLFEPGAFTGQVETRYSRKGIEFDEDVVEVKGVLLMLVSGIRDIRVDDAQKIRRLLDSL